MKGKFIPPTMLNDVDVDLPMGPRPSSVQPLRIQVECLYDAIPEPTRKQQDAHTAALELLDAIDEAGRERAPTVQEFRVHIMALSPYLKELRNDAGINVLSLIRSTKDDAMAAYSSIDRPTARQEAEFRRMAAFLTGLEEVVRYRTPTNDELFIMWQAGFLPLGELSRSLEARRNQRSSRRRKAPGVEMVQKWMAEESRIPGKTKGELHTNKTDQQITDMMNREGIQVSRTTVNNARRR